ncbi:MAG: GAF domain-containing protein [Chitinivibrionales bacterium]|nr:GAF domain-containing protein [Chitinivibrionales bacterium]
MDILKKFSGKKSTAIRLKKTVLLMGNDTENDIVLQEKEVPPIAARLERSAEGYSIKAIKPGAVKVNGKKIKNRCLAYGDRIEIGPCVFIFETGSEAGDAGPGVTEQTLGSFSRFCEAVGKERDLKTLLRKIITSLFEVIGGEEAFIFTVDTNRRPELFISSSDDNPQERFSDTIVQDVLASGKGIFVGNALDDPRFAQAQSIVDLKLATVLCSPIHIAGKTIGVIYLGSKKAAISFSEKELNTLQVYAQMAGMLINHVEYISQQNSAIERLADVNRNDNVVASSPVMSRLLEAAFSAARSDIAVLLEGETGTGKDLIAQAIHNRSSRKSKPFVVVNCSSLSGELLESELFGHKQGAFTGAVKDHKGLFSAANGGTLFMNEIGEMSIGLQAKLLRTLETGKIRAVGSSTEQSVDVRILCATNRDLKAMTAQKEFREDLYYRINQFVLKLPPLRERGEDIRLLAYYFLDLYKARYPHKDIIDFHPDALKAMSFYDWPGNVRELSSIVHKAVLSETGRFVRVKLEEETRIDAGFDEATREFQKKLIRQALAACNGSREKAAKMLGMSRSSFFRYLAQVNEG